MTIVFDAGCAFCRRCAAWLTEQRPALPLTVLPSDDPWVRAALGHLPEYGEELMVVADTGHVWAGPDGFIVALWCLAAYRSLANGLSGPLAHRSARALFHTVSANRSTLGEWLDGEEPCEDARCGR